MKKSGLIVLLALLLAGCQNDIRRVEGTYSYKTSGKAVITIGDSTATVVLDNEIGAMEIIGQKDDNVLLTFNQLGGSAFVTTGVLRDSVISLAPFDRGVDYLVGYDVVVSGCGHVYGSTIVFDLQYEGEHLNADEITMIAKRN